MISRVFGLRRFFVVKPVTSKAKTELYEIIIINKNLALAKALAKGCEERP